MNSTNCTIVKQFYALLLSLSLILTPVAGADAERIFAQVSPSVVVVSILVPGGEPIDNGSGVVVGEGIVVTNCHVVQGESVMVIGQPADSQGAKNYQIKADVIARDRDNDLCLLYAEGLTEPPAAPVVKLGRAKDLDIGEEIYAIGTPAGLDLSFSRGIVTQLRGIGIKGKAPIVQTDATTYGGSSGGGLFNKEGELVGIVTFGPERDVDNITFAMPVELVADLIQVVRHGEKERKAQDMCIESPRFQCILKLAQQTAKEIDDIDKRKSMLIRIATAQARAGYFEDAKITALWMPTTKVMYDYGYDYEAEEYIDEYSIDHASELLGDVAIEQAKSGNFDDAKVTAQQIDDAEYRAGVLGEIAIAQVQEGKFDEAKLTSKQTDDAEYLARVLTEIAIAQAQTGNYSGAKETAKQIDDTYNHSIVLDRIAFEQIKQAGHSVEVRAIIDDALHSARQINDASLRAKALNEISITQEKAGYSEDAKIIFGEALSSAEKIGNDYPYAETLRDIAISQATAYNFKKAKEIVKQINYFYLGDEALIEIVTAEAQAGKFVDAMQTADFIDDNELRTLALAEIVAAMTEQ